MTPGESVEWTDMSKAKIFLGVVCAIAIGLAACSGEQSDWEKARASNNADSYESFVKKYPTGSFAPQAQQRLKELYEERDWQKARDADTPESYQAFLKQYPEGKWAEEARIRVENFNLAQTPAGAAGPPGAAIPSTVSAGTAPPRARRHQTRGHPPKARRSCGGSELWHRRHLRGAARGLHLGSGAGGTALGQAREEKLGTYWPHAQGEHEQDHEGFPVPPAGHRSYARER